MRNIREQLYATKVALLAVLFTFIGLLALVAGAVPNLPHGWHWLHESVTQNIAMALFTTGLVVVAFTYIDGKDKEARDAERIGNAVVDKAPAIVQSVLDGLTASPDNMRMLAADQQDQLIRNGLAARLGDTEFAAEVYDDIRDQAVRAAERWHDLNVEIRLSLLPMGRRSTEGAPSGSHTGLFSVTVRCEYTVIPRHATRHFVCVSDKQEYRELTAEPGNTSAWYLSPRPGVDASAREAFELVQFTVDGQERPIRRSARKGGQTYMVNLGVDAKHSEQPVTIAYTYKTVTTADGHLLYFDLEQPTNGISVEIAYGETPIDTVSVLDFIASSRKARIVRSPAQVPERSVRLEFDGWAFPRSGVAFVWSSEASRAPFNPS